MENQTGTTKGPVRGKKLTAKFISMKNAEAGFSFSGKYLGVRRTEKIDTETGEVNHTEKLFLLDKDGNRMMVNYDSGLAKAVEESMIVEGDLVEFVRGEQISLSAGRKMNSYDVFQLDSL